MQVKKRKKTNRMRGGKNYGWGSKNNNRGSGHRGGVGFSGSGKRASQKLQEAQQIAYAAGFESYFGARGYTSGPTARKINKVMNLNDIGKNFNGQKEIKLEGYKILGEGEGLPITIHACCASKSAVEKMQKAGGKLVLEMTAINVQRAEKSKEDVKQQVKKDEKIASDKAAKEAKVVKKK